MNTQSESDAGEQFPVGVNRVAAVRSASMRLEMQLATIKQLADLKPGRRSKPEDLHQLEADMNRERRVNAHTALDFIANEIDPEIEAMFITNHDKDSNGDELQVIPGPEVLSALGMRRLGPGKVGNLTERLLGLCHGDMKTVEYVYLTHLWRKGEEPDIVLRRSLLSPLVASFEQFLMSLWTTWFLSTDPLSNPQSDDRTVLAAASKFATGLLKGPPSGWAAPISEHIGLEFANVSLGPWEQLCEIVLRRHAIEHSSGLADADYLKKIPGSVPRPRLGTVLDCSSKYIDGALVALESIADLLSVGYMARLAESVNDAAGVAVDPVFRALNRGEWRSVLFMADGILRGFPPDHPWDEIRVNRWMAMQELRQCNQGDLEREIRAWVPPEAKPQFDLAKAALLRDVKSACKSVRACALQGRLCVLAKWPLVIRLERESPKFAGEFRILTVRQAKKSRPRAAQQGRSK